jgi:hypothetical protein
MATITITIDAGRAAGPNTAAVRIFFSLPNQPVSTNVQDDSERIR